NSDNVNAITRVQANDVFESHVRHCGRQLKIAHDFTKKRSFAFLRLDHGEMDLGGDCLHWDRRRTAARSKVKPLLCRIRKVPNSGEGLGKQAVDRFVRWLFEWQGRE